MANRKNRKRATRRDRRKAKMSGWKRQGKKNSSKIGHGPGGGGQMLMTIKNPMKKKKLAPINKGDRLYNGYPLLTVSVADLIKLGHVKGAK